MINFHHISIKPLDDNFRLPTKGTPDSAGFDVYSVEDVVIPPGKTVMVSLGFSAEMSSAIHCQMKTRSGMGSKGIVVNAGIIDADYRGLWKVILQNTTDEPYSIAIGDRVAQFIVTATPITVLKLVEELSETSRGSGGYGSTGR